MIIKVCGMREPQNIREVAALAINWIGFIFYERSKRFVERCPTCLLYTSPSPRDSTSSRMPSSA